MKTKYVLFLLVIALIIVGVLYKPVCKLVYPLNFEEYITRYSDEYELDKYMIMAVIKAESNYNVYANSGVASGLMQITDETAKWIADKLSIDLQNTDYREPRINIKMGCYYMRYLLDYHKNDVNLALASYNAGMGNVKKWLENTDYSQDGKNLDDIPFEETKRYIEKVEKYIKVYKKLYK